MSLGTQGCPIFLVSHPEHVLWPSGHKMATPLLAWPLHPWQEKEVQVIRPLSSPFKGHSQIATQQLITHWQELCHVTTAATGNLENVCF